MAVKCILTGQTPSASDGVTEPVQTQSNDKVDKVTGKGLSTNDYTNAEKTKLSGIEAGAQKNTITGVQGSAETTYRTGNVNITATNIGLGNVNNTSDAEKPISTATKTALDGKQAKVTGAATTITDSNLTADRALISNSSGKVAVSSVTSTELGYLDGVTSNIQTQLNNKLSSAPVTSVNNKTGAVSLAKGDVGLGNVDNTSDANKPISKATQAALNDKQSKITANGILKGDGNGNITAADETEVELVDLPQEVFWATYGKTTPAELNAAWNAGKLIKLKQGPTSYELGIKDGNKAYFYGVLINSGDGSVRRAKLDLKNGTWEQDTIGSVCDIVQTISLPTASWTGSDPYTQTVSIFNSNAKTKVDIQPSEELYDQLVADNVGYLAIKNVNGTLTAVAKGGKPSVDLTVQVTYNNVY